MSRVRELFAARRSIMGRVHLADALYAEGFISKDDHVRLVIEAIGRPEIAEVDDARCFESWSRAHVDHPGFDPEAEICTSCRDGDHGNQS